MVRPAFVAVLFLGAAANAARSQAPARPSVDYALTNARVVTAPGRVIERATVLVRGGRIVEVGPQLSVPPGAVQIDLAGHSIYPGLIDAATSIGLPSPTRALPTDPQPDATPGGRGGGAGRGAGRGTGTPAPVTLPELDADLEAANAYAPTPEQLAALRAGGVTTVGLVFDGGIFPGRVGAALTGGPDESRLALRAGVGQQVSFGTKRGGYPATGIGAVAFVRQSFLDAQYENRAEQAFRTSAGGPRPSFDPARRALIPAATNAIQSWFVASTERQIQRVAEIAKEMELRNWIVVGAQEGWRASAALKQSAAPVVVSLNWPTPGAVTGRPFELNVTPISGRNQEAERGDTTAARALRANAVELARAGIPVAFASFGGESGNTFRDRIRATIEAGMSSDDALRAATITPATLLGINGAVGTIEPGKLANLVVVQGNDLFARSANVRHVFVEGRHYDLSGGVPAGGRGGRNQ